MNRQKDRMISINRNSFLMVCSVLFLVMLFSYALTFFLPRGQFVNGQYSVISGRADLSFWQVLLMPVLTFFDASTAAVVVVVSLFIVTISGVFNVIDRTGGILSILSAIIRRYENRKKIILYLVPLIFMLFGSLFGIFEESVALLPIIVMLAIGLGYDTFTGLCMCLVAAGFGFSCAVLNPFSIGLSVSVIRTQFHSDLQIYDGIWFRCLIFAVMYLVLCLFIRRHVRKIEKDPTLSATYVSDQQKRENMQLSTDQTDLKKVRVYTGFFATVVVITLLTALIPQTQDYTIPVIMLTFLIGMAIAGMLLHIPAGEVLCYFLNGAAGALPAVLMIMMASSVKLILERAQIIDTIIYRLTEGLWNTGPIGAVLLIYLAILVIQFFIGSASAKVVVIIPIIAAIVQQLGFFSQNLAVLAFIFGDGFTDLIYPTNPVLLIALGMVQYPYRKWVRHTILLQLVVLIITILFLLFGYAIGY